MLSTFAVIFLCPYARVWIPSSRRNLLLSNAQSPRFLVYTENGCYDMSVESEYSPISIKGINSRVDEHGEKQSEVESVCRVVCTVQREV